MPQNSPDTRCFSPGIRRYSYLSKRCILGHLSLETTRGFAIYFDRRSPAAPRRGRQRSHPAAGAPRLARRTWLAGVQPPQSAPAGPARPVAASALVTSAAETRKIMAGMVSRLAARVTGRNRLSAGEVMISQRQAQPTAIS